MYRENIFGCEIIVNTTRFLVPSQSGRSQMKNLFIFAMVKKDASNFLKKHVVKEIKWSSAVEYNNNANPRRNRELIGIDIDNAYWNIAHRMGIISENTYIKGLSIDDKRILLASLSTLGRDKRYSKMSDGSFTNDVIIIKGDDRLKWLYKKIRHTCYGYMKTLANKLGNNFVAYKTDCIYFFHSKKSMFIVERFLDQKDLDYKVVSDFDSFHDYVDD